MKRFFILIILSLMLVHSPKAQPTLSLGAEMNLATAYQTEFEKDFFIGYEPGVYINFSVLNKMGIDSKVTYQHLSKRNTSFVSTTLLQYYGNDYNAFGIGPVFYIPETENTYSFSHLKYGASIGYGTKYLGANATIEDFDLAIPTIKLKVYIRLGFIDKFIRI